MDGVILEPYRDYRGVEVIGAWRWLPKYDFGIAIETQEFELWQRPLSMLRRFGGMLTIVVCVTLLAICGGFAYFRWHSTRRR